MPTPSGGSDLWLSAISHSLVLLALSRRPEQEHGSTLGLRRHRSSTELQSQPLGNRREQVFA